MSKNALNDESAEEERRLHIRHRVKTTVYIRVPGGRRVLSCAANLSATGVYIRTASVGLGNGQKVELSFAINLGVITKIHRRTATVVHVSPGGTGLRIDAHPSAGG